ncbi:MAG: PilZ domain-containing protein [Candidatus Omnitrophica bacterium]|nr:PilZ domain-containing protein [Candidatus Omnitrophota bacterium]
MQQWDHVERRKLPRYELSLPARQTDVETLKGTQSITSDVSEQGMGVMMQEPVPLQVPLEIDLVVPDNNEKIAVWGKVVWVQAVKKNMYRAGICLDSCCLKPLMLVLRMIKMQLKLRYEVFR